MRSVHEVVVPAEAFGVAEGSPARERERPDAPLELRLGRGDVVSAVIDGIPPGARLLCVEVDFQPALGAIATFELRDAGTPVVDFQAHHHVGIVSKPLRWTVREALSVRIGIGFLEGWELTRLFGVVLRYWVPS